MALPVPHPAELVGAHRAAVGEFEQRGHVGEVVAPAGDGLVEDAVGSMVHDAEARHGGGVGGQRPEHPADGVGRVEHGREARGGLPVLAAAELVRGGEAVVHVVDVVPLGVEDAPEGPLGDPCAGVDHGRVVVAGLPHHVDQPGLLDLGDDGGDLLGADGHRHRGVDVLAGLERLEGQLAVAPALRHDGHRVDVGGQQRVDVGEAAGEAVLLDVLRGPLRDEVGHVDLLDGGVQLPEADETPGELPGSDDTDLHECAVLSTEGVGCRCVGRGDAVATKLPG